MTLDEQEAIRSWTFDTPVMRFLMTPDPDTPDLTVKEWTVTMWDGVKIAAVLRGKSSIELAQRAAYLAENVYTDSKLSRNLQEYVDKMRLLGLIASAEALAATHSEHMESGVTHVIWVLQKPDGWHVQVYHYENGLVHETVHLTKLEAARQAMDLTKYVYRGAGYSASLYRYIDDKQRAGKL